MKQAEDIKGQRQILISYCQRLMMDQYNNFDKSVFISIIRQMLCDYEARITERETFILNDAIKSVDAVSDLDDLQLKNVYNNVITFAYSTAA